jgi:hypothetical protein
MDRLLGLKIENVDATLPGNSGHPAEAGTPDPDAAL